MTSVNIPINNIANYSYLLRCLSPDHFVYNITYNNEPPYQFQTYADAYQKLLQLNSEDGGLYQMFSGHDLYHYIKRTGVTEP